VAPARGRVATLLVPGDGGTSRRVRFLPFSPKVRLTVDLILQSKSYPCSYAPIRSRFILQALEMEEAPDT
jgi:hypothetical protein